MSQKLRVKVAMSVTRWAAAAAIFGLAMVFGGAQRAPAATPGPVFAEFTNLAGTSTFPDPRNTRIYESRVSTDPATETLIVGRRPRARYFAFAAQDTARREVGSLRDDQISVGPDGRYEIVLRQDCAGAANCISLGAAADGGPSGRLAYRLYGPERDDCGAAGVPVVTFRALGERAASAAPATGCPPRAQGVDAKLRALSERRRPVGDADLGSRPVLQRYNPRTDGRAGGTKDNAYAYAEYDMKKGDLEVAALAPTYRLQHARRANRLARATGARVRYWSLCTNAFTRPITCLRDEEVRTDATGRFTAVVAPACPVKGYRNCLESGPATLTPALDRLLGRNPAITSVPPTLVYRNLVPAPGFANDEGPVRCPADRRDTQFCGRYAPRLQYVPRRSGSVR